MTTIHINPPGIEEEYLQCLNLCFGNWGNRQKFRWYFERKTAYPDADLIILKKDGHMIAGSAVCYRRVAFPNAGEVSVGIMTGSWTLPQFRGHGCFASIIKESVRLTAEKRAALLLAFVTEENGSFRQLARAGAALFPTSYLFSTPQTQPLTVGSQLKLVEKSEEVLMMLWNKLKESGKGCSRFIYPSVQDFALQFIHRPSQTEILTDGQGNFGVIEKTEETDLIQLHLTDINDETGFNSCLASFINHALGNRRKLFLFSTQPLIARLGKRLGLGIKPGYLTALVADRALLQQASGTPGWPITEHPAQTAPPDSLSLINTWNIQSGDRT